jgi:uroporphyrin-III C-methyltransferase
LPARCWRACRPTRRPPSCNEWAGGIDERRLLTRLDRLAADATDAGFSSPAVILVGSAIGESVERAWGARDDWRDQVEVMQGGEPLAHAAIAHAA